MAEQLQHIDLVAPGFLGLNLSQASNIISPRYATTAQNAVIDSSGRLAARAGYVLQTTTGIDSEASVWAEGVWAAGVWAANVWYEGVGGEGAAIKAIHEFREGDGTRSLIVAWDGGIANGITDPPGADISGAVVDDDGRWWFQNFNSKVIGFQHGQKPIVYTGTGNFATVTESAGTAPTSFGGIGLCAYGRVWAVDSDGQTIKYSVLLDETDWGGAGSGVIDMSSVWPGGMDTISALAAFNNRLVVFGKNHIIFFAEEAGTELGLDPDSLRVIDVIQGTGCLSQWTLQHIGESDIVYLSRNGVQSLGRIISEKSNPVKTLSKKVRAELTSDAAAGAATDVCTVYDPVNGFYLLSFPGGGRTWCLDTRYIYEDEEGDQVAIATTWTLAPYAWCIRDNNELLLGVGDGVGLYGGSDDDGDSFRFAFMSPWLDLGEGLANRLKILKRIGSILFIKNAVTLIFRWGVDFETVFDNYPVSLTGDSAAEWGISEFGTAEFSGGLTLRIIRVPARDTGQYFRVGVETDVSGTLALQQIELSAKIGRLA